MSIGGSVKYNPITRQPLKTGGGGNVSTLGQLDINALLSYEAHDILNELLSSRSDHHKIKRKMYAEIASTGELYKLTEDDNKLDKSGGTLELRQIYFTTLGLHIK